MNSRLAFAQSRVGWVYTIAVTGVFLYINWHIAAAYMPVWLGACLIFQWVHERRILARGAFLRGLRVAWLLAPPSRPVYAHYRAIGPEMDNGRFHFNIAER